jgi:hypothetical protein
MRTHKRDRVTAGLVFLVRRLSALTHRQRIGHELHWKLFIRLRSVTTRLPLAGDAMGVLRRLRDHGSFSGHRNAIQYTDHWPYSDLYELLNEAELGLLPGGWDVTENNLDRDLKVAQLFAFCSAHMVLDVLSPFKKLKTYCDQFRLRLAPEWHPLMNSGALSEALNEIRGRAV